MKLLAAACIRGVPGVAHGFSTAKGGLDLGVRAPLQSWSDAVQALHPTLRPERLVLLSQVHGAQVHVATEPSGPSATAAAADAVITTQPGLVLAIRTADCVPVVLAHTDGVGVVHAGWRGTAAGVVPASIAALCGLIGAGPEGVVAAIGPCISVGAYEVGEEVAQSICAAEVPRALFVDDTGDKPHVNLRAAVEYQLRSAGVGRVEHVGGCTYTDVDLHSYRRDGAASGRLAGLIARLDA